MSLPRFFVQRSHAMTKRLYCQPTRSLVAALSYLSMAVFLSACSQTSINTKKASEVNLTQKEKVANAFESVRNDPNMKVQFENGWLIASKDNGRLIFSFPPQDHPAYPSYIRRELIKRNKSLSVDLRAACGVDKFLCDQLLSEFVRKGTKALGRSENYMGALYRAAS